MKVQKALFEDNLHAWLVVDDDFMPIKPIFEYLRYLFNLQKSTINKQWNKISFNDVASFMGWLRLYQKENVIYKCYLDLNQAGFYLP